MTPTKAKADPLEVRTQAVLAREEEHRRDQARELAERELTHEHRANEEQALVQAADQRLRAMDPKAFDEVHDKAADALDKYAAAIDAWNNDLTEITETLLAISPPVAVRASDLRYLNLDVEANRVDLSSRLLELAQGIVEARNPRKHQ